MMNKTWKRPDFGLGPGKQVTGKWHHKHYLIKRELGSGAVGTVYLCEAAGGKNTALKISDNSTSMTMEVNVLKSLAKVQGSRLGPYLLDVDDWVSPFGVTYSFYVMEYVRGDSLKDFLHKHHDEWVGVFILQLLDNLERLHQAGWVFGDLKLDNLLISSSPPKIRFVDVGGTTQIGRAIKEYTEFYDRGYWGLGSRRAEPSYDLFALVMVFISVYIPGHFHKGSNPLNTILSKLGDIKPLKRYYPCFKKAILGKYQTSAQMKADIITVIEQAQKKQSSQTDLLPVITETIGFLMIAAIYYFSSLMVP